MRSRLVWCIGFGLLLGASAASAQGLAPEREAERTALYEQGVKLAEQGRWPEAAEKFRAVVALRSAPRVLFTLGEAQQKSGKLVGARTSYAKSLAEARASGDDVAAAAAQEALAALEPWIPRLVLRVEPRIEGAEASVDGATVPLDTGDAGVPIDPGAHRLVVRAPGRVTFEQVVIGQEGRSTKLVVVLGQAQPAPAARLLASGSPAMPADAASAGGPVGALVVGGIGAAALGVGVALYASGKGRYDEASDTCNSGRCPQQQAVDDGNAGRRQMIAGDVVGGVGIAALGGAGIWWAVSAAQSADGPVGSSTEPSTARAISRAQIGVVPWGGGAVVTVGGKL